VKARIVKIGNSRGVRIPKPLLQEAGLGEEVEIVAEGNRLIIAPADRPRAGWASSFQKMKQMGRDARMGGDEMPSTRWEEEEWEWE